MQFICISEGESKNIKHGNEVKVKQETMVSVKLGLIKLWGSGNYYLRSGSSSKRDIDPTG